VQTTPEHLFVILLALGANLPSVAGPPAATLRAALAALASEGVGVPAVSRLFVSPAWPDPLDPAFVNAVARIETALSPRALLEKLQTIEVRFGRQQGSRNAPRTLDLDILDYDNRIEIGPPELPHPRLQDRAFVLVPLADVAPDWVHPVTGRNVADLIAALGGAERNVQVQV